MLVSDSCLQINPNFPEVEMDVKKKTKILIVFANGPLLDHLGPVGIASQLNLITAVELLQKEERDMLYVVLDENCAGNAMAHILGRFIPHDLWGKVVISRNDFQETFFERFVFSMVERVQGEEVNLEVLARDILSSHRISETIMGEIAELSRHSKSLFPRVSFSVS